MTNRTSIDCNINKCATHISMEDQPFLIRNTISDVTLSVPAKYELV